MAETHSGGCLCGRVRYEVSGPLDDVVYCHCEQCRRQSGSWFAATRTNADALTIEGEANLTWFAASDDAKRAFCRHCGSHLFWRRNGSDEVSILAGSLDVPTGLHSREHIFVADKADWYEITDGLPQHAQG